MSAGAAQPQAGDMFATLDRNQDGVISREEFYAGMQGAQVPQTVVYGAGNVPMEPVATMIPGQASSTIYAAPQVQTATVLQQMPAATQQLPATTVTAEPVYATVQQP